MIEALRSKWWLLLLRGLAAIGVAIIAFAQPASALILLVLVLGAYAFVSGMLAFAAAVVGVGGDRWWGLLLEGIVGIIAAVLIWSWPLMSTLVFVYFVGAWLIVSGAVQVTAGVQLRDFIDNEWLFMLSGIISIAFGAWVLRDPTRGAVALEFLLGWYFLLFGVTQIVVAFRLRALPGKTQHT